MSFGDDLRKFAEKSVKSADQTRRAVTLELFNSVILDTPVDTGRARGNWQATTSVPAQGDTDRTGGQPAVDEAELIVGGSKPDSTLYLTNNLPYIERLEYGYSGQAPAGMVRKNVGRLRFIVREKAAKAKA